MECPYCKEELFYHDYYFTGRPASFHGTTGNGLYYPEQDYKKLGDIFKCENEDCEAFDEHFYTDIYDDLNEGYPC